MDLYLEFRKLIRPLIIPGGEEEKQNPERYSSRNKPANKEHVRQDEKDKSIRSMVTCKI